MSSTPTSLISLPYEIKKMIFESLDQNSSYRTIGTCKELAPFALERLYTVLHLDYPGDILRLGKGLYRSGSNTGRNLELTKALNLYLSESVSPERVSQCDEISHTILSSTPNLKCARIHLQRLSYVENLDSLMIPGTHAFDLTLRLDGLSSDEWYLRDDIDLFRKSSMSRGRSVTLIISTSNLAIVKDCKHYAENLAVSILHPTVFSLILGSPEDLMPSLVGETKQTLDGFPPKKGFLDCAASLISTVSAERCLAYLPTTVHFSDQKRALYEYLQPTSGADDPRSGRPYHECGSIADELMQRVRKLNPIFKGVVEFKGPADFASGFKTKRKDLMLSEEEMKAMEQSSKAPMEESIPDDFFGEVVSGDWKNYSRGTFRLAAGGIWELQGAGT